MIEVGKLVTLTRGLDRNSYAFGLNVCHYEGRVYTVTGRVGIYDSVWELDSQWLYSEDEIRVLDPPPVEMDWKVDDDKSR